MENANLPNYIMVISRLPPQVASQVPQPRQGLSKEPSEAIAAFPDVME